MTADERKILAWRRESYNKKGFKSQAEYHDFDKARKALFQEAREGKWTPEMLKMNLVYKLGYGPQRAHELANRL